MSVPRPFKISVTDEEIEQLRQRLALTRFPDELEDAGCAYGVPKDDLRRLVSYWQDGYDWRKHEKELNESLPQYTIDIEVADFEKLNIHFVHEKSQKWGAIPLLFVHGCKYRFFCRMKVEYNDGI